MIEDIVTTLGPWNWWILALVLIGLEILVPGTFFLWFGISAFVIGSISLAVGGDGGLWVWQTQLVAFVTLSLVSALLGRRFMPRVLPGDNDEPNLNNRGAQMVGRTATLDEPIREGSGRAKLGDTVWRISGPDLPAGTRVRVVASESNTLIVEGTAEEPAARPAAH